MEGNEHIEQLWNLNEQFTAVQKEEMKERLAQYLNYLLLHDFNKLVQILYRVDVNEQRLKELLQNHPGTDAAIIIADLLIQRQQEKIESRQSFKSNDNIPDEEKW